MKKHIIFGILVSVALFYHPALAHDLWLTMDSYQVGQNKAATGTVYSSHHFPAPASDAMKPDRMDRFFFVSPGGRQSAATDKGNGIYTSNVPLKQSGTYVTIALPINGFATKTPDGYLRGKSRKDAKDAILCRYSQKSAKAIFAVGGAGGDAYSRPLGHAMEIIPLKDPLSVKTGDVLPVKILLEGQPARTFVYGTYAGFTEAANTFAYTTRTDKDGIAEIKMIHKGTWLLIVKAEESYADTTECDKQSWAASLTFEIK
jgi:uncharacterized GH25 family protein